MTKRNRYLVNKTTKLFIGLCFFIEGIFRGKLVFAAAPESRFATSISKIYSIGYIALILYGVLQIIVAGYRIIRSEGEPRALDDAKQHLTGSIIGVIFVILAVVILRLIISSVFEVDII